MKYLFNKLKKINKVLFCVLNWGLGHASRSTPVIEYLFSKGIQVVIASDGDALLLLQQKFPKSKFIELPPYKIQYSKSSKTLPFKLLCQVPKLIRSIENEKNKIHSILDFNHDYDLIISDNRYGCYSSSIPSILICHQLNIKTPKALKWVNKINSNLLSKFNSIWLPDNEENLSGELSSTRLKHTRIGLLSSYSKTETNKDIDFLIVLSGPEPQRSLLEIKLLQSIPTNSKSVMVRGTSIRSKISIEFEHYDLASQSTMNDLLNRSKLVISRSGYSSIMDYKTLGIPAILIPTPGQTEQEYLANHLDNNPQFKTVNQKNISNEMFNSTPVSNYKQQKGPIKLNEEALIKSLNNLGITTLT